MQALSLSLYCGVISNHGQLGELQSADFISAIDKRVVSGEIMLTKLGLEGDQQAETSYHGGVDRALCHYPQEHYGYWQHLFPASRERFNAPAFGENLSTCGMTEQTVYIGDIYRWADALIQVTEPRSPCYKLNCYFAISNLSGLMQDSGRCGWLYRVLQPGKVYDQAPLELVSRLSETSVAEALAVTYHQPFDVESYQRLLACAGLAASWSAKIQQRLLHGKIESFDRRLYGSIK